MKYLQKTTWMLCLSIILVSCQKETRKTTPRFLDVNIRFSGAGKPAAGDMLVLNLYYKPVSGLSPEALHPDATQTIVLDQEKIDAGFRATFESYPREATIFLSAYIDADQDGTLSTGDFALFYPDVAFSEVASQSREAENITLEYAVTLDMNLRVGGTAGGVVDIDGNIYKTVVIGGQEWMAENLKVTRYRDGSPIPTGLDAKQWAETTLGAYALYPFSQTEGIHSDQEMIDSLGLLYNWYAVDNPKGLCPEGWKVPDDNDWKTLERTIGMDGADIDEANWRGEVAALLMGKQGWNTSEVLTPLDEYGFNALPVGARYPDGSYKRLGTYAYFWTSSPSGTQGGKGIRRLITYDKVSINRSNRPASEGQCIRCVKIQYDQ